MTAAVTTRLDTGHGGLARAGSTRVQLRAMHDGEPDALRCDVHSGCHGLPTQGASSGTLAGGLARRSFFPSFNRDASPSLGVVMCAAGPVSGLRFGGFRREALLPPCAGSRQPHSREDFGQRKPRIMSAHPRLQFLDARSKPPSTARRVAEPANRTPFVVTTDGRGRIETCTNSRGEVSK